MVSYLVFCIDWFNQRKKIITTNTTKLKKIIMMNIKHRGYNCNEHDVPQ